MDAEVPLFTHDARDDWESHIIRGALLYHGIDSRIVDLSLLEESDADICVALPTSSDRLDVKWNPEKT